ncbi:hypothetical protein R1flu_016671 [Riccia fluitans]|uniref:F-box protein n=1 Tax=Riccia fluitans TaxID=41844 RepID=A0ABD1YMN6_9MARC
MHFTADGKTPAALQLQEFELKISDATLSFKGLVSNHLSLTLRLMENHDVETELPEGLKEMLRRLRGQLAPGESCVTENPDLKNDEFGDYFQCIVPTDKQIEVRRRILDAIGNCSSMEIFREEYLIYSGLDSEEWEMVLSPLRNNSSLKKVSLIPDCDYYESVEQVRGKLWQQLLRTSQTLKVVEIRFKPVRQLMLSTVLSNAMLRWCLNITDVLPGDVNRWCNVIKETVPASTSVNISVNTVDFGGPRTAEPESFRLKIKMGASSPSHSLKIDLRFQSAGLEPRGLVTAITKFLYACPPASLKGYVYYHVDKFHEEMRWYWGSNKDESYEVLNWAFTHDVVKELCVIVPEREDSRLQRLFQRMQTNSSVLKLSLRNVPSSCRSFWKSLFVALKYNTSLRCLDLAGCHLKDENFHPIMSLLQDNYTLEKLTLNSALQTSAASSYVDLLMQGRHDVHDEHVQEEKQIGISTRSLEPPRNPETVADSRARSGTPQG